MSAPIVTELPVRGTYCIAPTLSGATFRARGLFGLPVRGRMPIRSGTVRIEDGQARIAAELDPAAIETGIRRRDKDLRSPQLLDVARFPAVSFEGELSGAVVHGRLTVHGESVATTLDVEEVCRHVDGVDVVATVRLDRRAFGVTGYRGVIQRHIDVTLTVSLVPEG
jgi:polyisoprenoid-binding protein YceI